MAHTIKNRHRPARIFPDAQYGMRILLQGRRPKKSAMRTESQNRATASTSDTGLHVRITLPWVCRHPNANIRCCVRQKAKEIAVRTESQNRATASTSDTGLHVRITLLVGLRANWTPKCEHPLLRPAESGRNPPYARSRKTVRLQAQAMRDCMCALRFSWVCEPIGHPNANIRCCVRQKAEEIRRTHGVAKPCDCKHKRYGIACAHYASRGSASQLGTQMRTSVVASGRKRPYARNPRGCMRTESQNRATASTSDTGLHCKRITLLVGLPANWAPKREHPLLRPAESGRNPPYARSRKTVRLQAQAMRDCMCALRFSWVCRHPNANIRCCVRQKAKIRRTHGVAKPCDCKHKRCGIACAHYASRGSAGTQMRTSVVASGRKRKKSAVRTESQNRATASTSDTGLHVRITLLVGLRANWTPKCEHPLLRPAESGRNPPYARESQNRATASTSDTGLHVRITLLVGLQAPKCEHPLLRPAESGRNPPCARSRKTVRLQAQAIRDCMCACTLLVGLAEPIGHPNANVRCCVRQKASAYNISSFFRNADNTLLHWFGSRVPSS